MSIDTYITVGGVIASVGGAYAVIKWRLDRKDIENEKYEGHVKDQFKEKDDQINNIWGQITKVRDALQSHEKEAADQRLAFVNDMNRIQRDSVTKEEMRRDMEKVYGKLDDLSEKMDRYFQSKGN